METTIIVNARNDQGTTTRQNLCNALDESLMLSQVRIRAGHYEVTIRTMSDEEIKELEQDG